MTASQTRRSRTRERRGVRSARRTFAATVLGFMVGACGGDDEATRNSTTSTSSTSSTTSTTVPPSSSTTVVDESLRLTQSCTHEERDVRTVVRYPEGWHVNTDAAVPCSAFDPEPVDLRPGTEFPLDLAVVVRVEPVGFSQASRSSGMRVEDRRRLRVDGRDAVRLEGESTGGPMTSEGRRSVRYVIDGGDERSIIATTWDVEGNDFDLSRRALDRMVDAFEIDPRL